MRAALCIALIFLLAACSDDAPEGTGAPGTAPSVQESAPAQSVGPSEAAGQLSLRITPPEAMVKTSLGLMPRGFRLDEARITWLLNGSPASTLRPYNFDPAELGARKGDTVQAVAVVGESEVASNVVEIRNTPPALEHVKLVPEFFKSGDNVGVQVEASDADGDPVTVEYQWSVNGEPAGAGSTLDAPLSRGDSFSVRVRAYDGEAYSQDIVLDREAANLPPMFTQHTDYSLENNLYSYTVKASDPDGDELTYELREGPEGMTIDSRSGLVQWQVPGGFSGTASFTVTASDGSGGKSEMTLRFSIMEEKKQEKKKEEAEKKK